MRKITIILMSLLFWQAEAQVWSQLGLDIDGESAGDQSGSSISMSSDGSTLAIASQFNGGSGFNAGHVRVYSWNGMSWVQQGADIDGEAAGDQSGSSVGMSADGSTLAIGAIYNNSSGNFSGQVRVYSWNGTSWVQQGADIYGEALADLSGYSVSMSADGSTLAIGAIFNDGGGSDAGHVRVYSWNGTSWVQQGADIDGDAVNDQSGYSVSLSADGSTLAIGTPLSGSSAFNAGHVRVYSWNGTSWVQQGADIDGEAAGDNSGSSISLSANGSTLAIATPFNDGGGSDAGHVRVYSWNGTSWVQQGADIDGEAAGDASGWAVSLSANGLTLAIGAISNDVGGTNTGQVRVYSWNGTSWVQQGADIDGEAVNDQSGWTVSLSADGSILAIGAPFNDGSGIDAGHLRVYNFSSPEVTWTGTTSTDWNVASNWSSGSVPTATESIIIPFNPTGGLFPTTTSDITVQEIEIEPGATLSVGAGFGFIQNTNGVMISNGSFVLLADASGTAWFDDFTNVVSFFAGNITVQQYVSIGSAVGQRMFGTPVFGGVVQGLDQTYASGSTGQILMTNCASAQVTAASPYNNLFEWQEDAVSPNSCEYEGWFAISQSSPLENARGYSGWMQSGSTISFTGLLNTSFKSYGALSLSNSATGLVNKDGWHVLSNPYPSAMEIDLFISPGTGWQSPQTYNASQAFGGTFQPILPGDNIAIAQGFVAKTDFANNTAIFSNDMRKTGSATFKSNNDWFDAKLEIEVSNGTKADITYIYFNGDASQAFDNQWDCEKRDSDAGNPTLFTQTTGVKTSLNGNSTAELGNYSFPLGLNPGSNSNFTFTAVGLNSFPATTMIYLEDKATGTWTNLRDNNTYTFNMTTQEAEDRFEIHFTKPLASTYEAESCEGNDGSITVDFGNQTVAGNLITWDYEIQKDLSVIASASESGMMELVDLEPGVYEITFTNGNLQVTEWITIEDKEEVAAIFDAPHTEVYVGDEITLANASVGANAYTWEVNGETLNTQDLTYTFLAAGNYLVSLFAENADCDALTEQTIEVLNKTTGIAEQVALDNILVYTKDNSIVIDISQADLEGQTDLEVYNTLGQLILQKLDIQTIEKIEMANQARGYYFVNIINQQEQISKKVIIK